MTKGPDFVMAQRLNFVKRWTARAQQLRTAEIKFHESLNPAVEKVVHEQQFLLLLEMLQELSFPKYRTLVQLMYTVSPLVGQLEETTYSKDVHLHAQRLWPIFSPQLDRARRRARPVFGQVATQQLMLTSTKEPLKRWIRAGFGPLVEAGFFSAFSSLGCRTPIRHLSSKTS